MQQHESNHHCEAATNLLLYDQILKNTIKKKNRTIIILLFC